MFESILKEIEAGFAAVHADMIDIRDRLAAALNGSQK
jgi:hypothetical protein